MKNIRYPFHFFKSILMAGFLIFSTYVVGAGLDNNIDFLPRLALAGRQIGACSKTGGSAWCSVTGVGVGVRCGVGSNYLTVIVGSSKKIKMSCEGGEVSASRIEAAAAAYVKTMDADYSGLGIYLGAVPPPETNCTISPSSLTIEHGQLHQNEVNGNQTKKEFNISCTGGAADITISLGKEQSGMSVTDVDLGGGIFSNLSTSSNVHVDKDSSTNDYVISKLSAPSLIKAGRYSGSATMTFNWK